MPSKLNKSVHSTCLRISKYRFIYLFIYIFVYVQVPDKRPQRLHSEHDDIWVGGEETAPAGRPHPV